MMVISGKQSDAALKVLELVSDPKSFKEKIQELKAETQKANDATKNYNEIIQKANLEAAKIVDDSRIQAGQIITKAKKDAQDALQAANDKINVLRTTSISLDSEVKNKKAELTKLTNDISSMKADIKSKFSHLIGGWYATQKR